MTRQRKIIAVISGALAIYIIGVYFVLSAVLTRILPGKLSELLKRQVTIEHIRVNPFTLSVLIKGFDLKEVNGKDSFVRFDSLYVNAEILSVFKRGLIVKTVNLEKPEINIERLEESTFNFTDLLNSHKKPVVNKDEKKEPENPFHFAVADITIAEGSIIYNDVPLTKHHTISPINWKLPFISNFTKHQDRFSEPAMTFDVDGASVSIDVQSKLFKNTMETIVAVSVKGISIPYYTAYVPSDLIKFKVDQGVIDIATEVSFRKESESTVVVAKGDLTLSDLDVKDMSGNEVVVLPKLEVALLPSVITDNSLHFGDILLQKPSVSAIRKVDGAINLLNLIAKKEKKTATPGIEARPDKKSSDKPFKVSIDRFKLAEGTASFNDFATNNLQSSEAAKGIASSVNDINLTVESFSTAPGEKAAFQLKTNINRSAPFSFNGALTLTPLTIESDAALSGLALSLFQPYLPENVRLVITGGKADASAHISLSKLENDKLSATVTGNTAIRQFATVDLDKAESFLGWSDFTIDGIDVSIWPLRIGVDKIAFNKLNNQLVVYEDGTSNLDTIFIKQTEDDVKPKKTEGKPKPSEITPLRIGEFVMKKSKFSFKDRSLTPHYSTYFFLKNLSVKGLTSENFKAADVVAIGSVDGAAPVNISGTINPLAKDLFVDLDFKVEHMGMVPFSAYTGKYIGRAIEKGKLNVDVGYHIKEKEIQANNHVLIDQFTFGKKVDSPDAMNLPVGLAVSLLTDRKGIINIDLPVSGRTDDPEFAWGKVVLKALGNLIMKAATSPFALVGSLVGGGEEMRFIEFKSGSSELDDIGEKKLESIRKLLVERPALKMEVVGYADMDTDRKALAELALERKIKARDLMKASKNSKNADAKTLAAIVLSPDRREEMLRKLYNKEVVEKKEDGTIVKKLNDPTLTSEEMKKSLLKRMIVNDAELQLLAMERAANVKKRLLQDAAVSDDRVFLKEPENPLNAEKNDFKLCRVELGVN